MEARNQSEGLTTRDTSILRLPFARCTQHTLSMLSTRVAAYTLGAGGAIPFIALTPQLAPHLPFPPLRDNPAHWQCVYGASILSFLGGVQWGTCISASSGPSALARLAWSVTPSLIAWPAAATSATLPEQQSHRLSLPLVAGGLASSYIADTRIFHAGLPSWYSPLRLALSTVAIASLTATSLHSSQRTHA
jgi:hypothetical protein